MIIEPGVVQSINTNFVDISSGWLWSSAAVYSGEDYETILKQPISVEAETLNDLRFLAPTTTLVIRVDSTPMSQVLWAGNVTTIPDPSGGGGGGNVLMKYAGVSDPVPPTVTDLGLGFVAVSGCNVNMYATPDFTGLVTTHAIAGTTVVLTPGAAQFLCATYNAGAPQYYVESVIANITGSDIVPIYAMWLAPTGPGGAQELHSTSFDSRGIGLPNKIADMITNTRPYSVAIGSSLVVGETATPAQRTLTISGAVVYAGVDAITLSPLNSSVAGNRLTLVHHTAGVWTYTNQTQYDNTQYDNGTDLVTMGNNRFGVRWVYRSIGDDIQSFYVATGNYANIADAKAEGVPTGLPPVVQTHSVLVGRLIIQKGLAAAVEIEQVSTTTFTSSTPATHNALNGLQGNGPEYYHLTAAQYASFIDIPNVYLPLTAGPTKTLTGTLHSNVNADGALGPYAGPYAFQASSTQTSISLMTSLPTNPNDRNWVFSVGSGGLYIGVVNPTTGVMGTGISFQSVNGIVTNTTVVGDLSVSGGYGSVTAFSFVKPGGTAAQFLKANGSVDSTVYAPLSALDDYLPLVGGTLSGNLYIVTPSSAAEIGMSSGVASANVTISFTTPGVTWYTGQVNSGVSGVPAGSFLLGGPIPYSYYATSTLFQHGTNVGVTGNVTSTSYMKAGVARMSSWANDATYARFGHNSFDTAAGFGFLQGSTGHSYIEAPTGTQIHLRINGPDIATVSNTGVAVTGLVSATNYYYSNVSATNKAAYVYNTTGVGYCGLAGSTNTSDLMRFVRCGSDGTIAGLNNIAAASCTFDDVISGNARMSSYLSQTAAWFGYNGFNLGASTGAGFWAWSDGGVGVDVVSTKTFSLRLGGTNKLTVDSNTVAVTGKLTVSSYPVFFGATLQSWGSGRNVTTLGGTVSIEQVNSGGDFMIIHNNCYFDGTNNKSISASTAACTQLLLAPNGNLAYSYAPQNGAGGIINLVENFAVLPGGDVQIYGATNFLKSGTGTYTRNQIYVDNTWGFVIERGRATDSSTAAIRSFRVSQRGGGTDYFEVADGTTYNRQSLAIGSVTGPVTPDIYKRVVCTTDSYSVMVIQSTTNNKCAELVFTSASTVNSGTSWSIGKRDDGLPAGGNGSSLASPVGGLVVWDNNYAKLWVNRDGGIFIPKSNNTAHYIGNWAGPAYWGIGGTTDSSGVIRIGQCSSVGAWSGSAELRITGTINPSAGIVGVTGASNAASGIVGEYVSTALSNASTVSVPTSGTIYQIFAITLSGGDWDVSATVMFTGNASAMVRCRAGIEEFNDRITADGFEGDTMMPTGSGSKAALTIYRRISTNNVTWTYYVMVQMSGTYGASGVWGSMRARRVR